MSSLRIAGTTIDGRRITRWFAWIAGLLIAAHLTLQVVEHFGGGMDTLILDLFDVDREDTFPTWFSSSALLTCAALLGVIAQQRRGERFARHWLAMALMFVALSADEIAGIHEAFNTVSPVPWTLPAAIATLVVGLAYLPFLAHLERPIRRRLILAGILYVGGAVVIEQVQAWFIQADTDSFAYAIWSAAEEGAEMAGAVLFLGALFRLLEEAGGRAPSPEDARPH